MCLHTQLIIHKFYLQAKIEIMRKIGTIILMLISINLTGQNLAKCGIDNNPKLTQSESEFLNEYMTEHNKQNFDFTNKKVVFVTGNSGNKLGNKSDYFNKIKQWNQSDYKIATWVVKLTEEEQIESDYNVIVTYWVKVVTEKRKRKILNDIKACR